MLDEHRLSNDGTEASGEQKPHDSDDQVYEKDNEIAHLGMISKPEKHTILCSTQQFAIDRIENPRTNLAQERGTKKK